MKKKFSLRRDKSRLYKDIFIIIIFLIFCSMLGCVSLPSKNLEKTRYGLDVGHPPISKEHFSYVIEVAYPQVLRQFNSAGFVYRTSDMNYVTDYYNVFIDSPSELIKQGVINYLQATKIFKLVESNTYPVKADYILKTYVKEFYGDYRSTNSPQAVFTVRFVLIDNSDKHNIVLNKEFTTRIPVAQKTSAAYVTAEVKALQNNLELFAIYLKRILVHR